MTDQPHYRELLAWPNSGRFLLGRSRSTLPSEDRTLLEAMIEDVEDVPASTRIGHCGTRCDRATLIVDGFALRTMDGEQSRQIVGCHVPGDFIDLNGFICPRLDHNIDTLGPARVGFIDHSQLRQTISERPLLRRALWFSTSLDGAIHREWILAQDHLTVPRRIARLFCEIACRLEMVELALPDGFRIPLTQRTLAEMVGATHIHVNRALASLRRMDLASFEKGRVRFPDRTRLVEFASFQPDYLFSESAFPSADW